MCAHQLMTHSATYSNATNTPTMDQYIAHRLSSGSEWGRWLRALKVAKQGRRNANQALLGSEGSFHVNGRHDGGRM